MTSITFKRSYILRNADDTAVISHNRILKKNCYPITRTNEQINELVQQMEIKKQSNEIQMFSHTKQPTVMINNHVLTAQTTVKYLGVSLDRLYFDNHAKRRSFLEENTFADLQKRMNQ